MGKCDNCGVEMPDDAGWILTAECLEYEEYAETHICHECYARLEWKKEDE